MSTVDNWFNQALEVSWRLAGVKSAVLCNFKLGLIDVTILVADG